MNGTEASNARVRPLQSWLDPFKGSLTMALVCAAGALSAIEVHRWATGEPLAGMQLVAELLIFASALVGSIGGFAFSAFAGAGLAHLFGDPVRSVEVLAMCSVTMQAYSVVRLWRSIRWWWVLRFVAGGVLTAPLAVQWLTSLSSPAFSTGLGVFLVVYGAYMLVRRPRAPLAASGWMDVAAGALGGITGGLAAFPGAFVVPWCGLRGYDKDTARGICQAYILIMQIVVLTCIRSRAVALDLGMPTIAYLAAALLATHLGIAVFRALSNRQFCLLVHGLLIVSGLSLAAKVL